MDWYEKSDFAKHIDELQEPLDRPYSTDIDADQFNKRNDVNYLNREIQDINPDYLVFFPYFFWFYHVGIVWTYYTVAYFIVIVWLDIKLFHSSPVFNFTFLDYFSYLLLFIACCTLMLLLLFQLIYKHPLRTQYYFLKQHQKVVYFYRPILKLRQPYKLKIVDYKDIIPDIMTVRYSPNFRVLCLYVADPDTGKITHCLYVDDLNVDAHVQWNFIRCYMERPANELPINDYAQAYPKDTTQSLFACSDILFRKHHIIDSKHSDAGVIVMLFAGSLFALGYLWQANNYQCSKQAILDPEVDRLLSWDGNNNPYPIKPLTDEAKRAFAGKSWQVNLRWMIAIVLNIMLFCWLTVLYI